MTFFHLSANNRLCLAPSVTNTEAPSTVGGAHDYVYHGIFEFALCLGVTAIDLIWIVEC